MNEAALTKNILVTLNSHSDCKAIKVHGSQFTEAGTPDILGCWRGIMFTIEVKAAKATTPTAIQLERLNQWRQAGAVTMLMRPPLQFATLWADLLAAKDRLKKSRKS